MLGHQQLDTDLSRAFFAGIAGIHPRSERQYDCAGISDIHYAQPGVLRTLGSPVTGQEFLQYHADQDVADIDPGHFFKALRSPRKLANITSPNDLLAAPMAEHDADPYAQCHELDDWEVHVVDGHYHKAACFDPEREASDGGTRATATGHFFRMDMRTHHLSCLAMAEPRDGKKWEHDMAAIKRSTAEALRYGAGAGRKVMFVWDKACIDYRHRFKLKHTYGIYFTTCEKSNSAAEICSANLPDRSEPRNEGVVSDHLAGTPDGVQLRRVVYINPEDGAAYTYLTNDFTLPPYLIVLLCKHRWDIEKIFHQLKSKMNERKSRASSTEAKKSHAIFECLSHNLLLLFEKHIERTEGVRDEVEERKQAGRIKAAPATIVRAARNFINSALARATQRTQRFIRWVRVRLYLDVPWSESMARLREIWTLPA